MLAELVRDLEKELKLSPLIQEKKGTWQLPIAENVKIQIAEAGEGILLFANLAPLPSTKQEDFFVTLLDANLFGQATFNAILGLSEDGKNLTLSRTIEYNSDYKEFRSTLEDFINATEFWHLRAIEWK